MSFLTYNSRTCNKVELRPKQCIDAVLKPLIDIVNKCRSKVEFVRFIFSRYPKQAESVSRDYRNFYGLQKDLEICMIRNISRKHINR
jgi:hypothetical protein